MTMSLLRFVCEDQEAERKKNRQLTTSKSIRKNAHVKTHME